MTPFATTLKGSAKCRMMQRLYREGRLDAETLAAHGLTPEGGCGPPPKSRGLGDTIAKVTTALGIKPCGGCKKRQDKINQLVPYRPK